MDTTTVLCRLVLSDFCESTQAELIGQFEGRGRTSHELAPKE